MHASVRQVKASHNMDSFTATFPAYGARLQFTFSPYFTDYVIKDGASAGLYHTRAAVDA
jgi:hypothetical protein